MRDFPQLKNGQFAVLMADGATGHVLLESGEISTSDMDDIYKVFSGLESATEYILAKQKENDTWEFVVKDDREVLVKYFGAIRWSQ